MLQEVIFALFFMTRPTTFTQQALEFIGVLTDSDTFKALPLRRMIVRFNRCNNICKWLDFLVFSDKDDKP